MGKYVGYTFTKTRIFFEEINNSIVVFEDPIVVNYNDIFGLNAMDEINIKIRNNECCNIYVFTEYDRCYKSNHDYIFEYEQKI